MRDTSSDSLRSMCRLSELRATRYWKGLPFLELVHIRNYLDSSMSRPQLHCVCRADIGTHGSLRRANPHVVRRRCFGIIADITTLLDTDGERQRLSETGVFVAEDGRLHQNALDPVVRQGPNSVVQPECGAWQNTIRRCNSGCDIHPVGT